MAGNIYITGDCHGTFSTFSKFNTTRPKRFTFGGAQRHDIQGRVLNICHVKEITIIDTIG